MSHFLQKIIVLLSAIIFSITFPMAIDAVLRFWDFDLSEFVRNCFGRLEQKDLYVFLFVSTSILTLCVVAIYERLGKRGFINLYYRHFGVDPAQADTLLERIQKRRKYAQSVLDGKKNMRDYVNRIEDQGISDFRIIDIDQSGRCRDKFDEIGRYMKRFDKEEIKNSSSEEKLKELIVGFLKRLDEFEEELRRAHNLPTYSPLRTK